MAYTTINKSTDYFNTKLYTGNASSRTISGIGFQPDFTWTKNRGNDDNNYLFDAVRGTTKYLISDSTAVEGTTSGITGWNADGYTLGSSPGLNANGVTAVSWNWKAGTTGSGTTTGYGTGKAYSYSVSTTAGFSIVKYVGNGSAGHTIPQHLSAVPKTIIVKKINASGTNWEVYHASLGNDKAISLDSTGAAGNNSNWNSTTPTSSVFAIGSGGGVNANDDTYIAYCFAEKQGYSKFGSYTGNGNNDGTFIYTGFKPAFVMIKRTSNTDNWYMKDNKRSGTAALQNFGQMNPNQTQHPSANNSNAENKASAFATDILSNGFKLRGTDAGLNQSGESYIYMCFAEAPLVGTNNVPCTAR